MSSMSGMPPRTTKRPRCDSSSTSAADLEGRTGVKNCWIVERQGDRVVGASSLAAGVPQAEQNAPGSAKAAPQLWQNFGIEAYPARRGRAYNWGALRF